MSEVGFICCGVGKKCYAVLWSYGEICVGCGCCHKDPKIRKPARLKYWKWWLQECLLFSDWADDPETIKIQKRNNQANIREAKRRVKYYSR